MNSKNQEEREWYEKQIQLINSPDDPLGEPVKPWKDLDREDECPNYSDYPSDCHAETIHDLRTPNQGSPVNSKEEHGLNIMDWGIRSYQGAVPSQKFLIEGTFPMASVSIFAAAGGVGKGMLMINLALDVACSTSDPYKSSFGPPIKEHGSVVVFCAEDSQAEIHRRLELLDTENRRAYIETAFNPNYLKLIPLPNAGGGFSIIEQGSEKELRESALFKKIKDDLKQIKNLKLIVFDPLASFICGADTNDAGAMTFLMNTLQKLSSETGACCIITHHTNKPSKNQSGKIQEPGTLEELYHSMRGSSAIGNGARLVYVMGPAPSNIQQKVSKVFSKEASERHSVYIGGVAKSNGKVDWNEHIFLRSQTGLLKNVTEEVNQKSPSKQALEKLLIEAISEQESKNAFTKTGDSGVYERRDELPSNFHSLSRNSLENMITGLLTEKKIGRYAKVGGKQAHYLGTPEGLLSMGQVEEKKPSVFYDASLKEPFVKALYKAEEEGQPFNKSGNSAPWKRKSHLPSEMHELTQKQLEKMTEDVLKEGRAVLCIYGIGKTPQWLCNPTGPLAKEPDQYEFTRGAAVGMRQIN